MKRLRKTLYEGWMAFARLLGRAQTFLILALIYLVPVGLTALFTRIISGDPLDRRLHDRATIWRRKGRTNLTLEEARRLF